jgi:fatty-acid desaturase
MWWWQVDVSYWAIRALALCRLAWNVKVPDAARIAEKILAHGPRGAGAA